MSSNYLRKEIIEALAKHGFTGDVDNKALKPRSPSKSAAAYGGHLPRNTIALRNVDCPPIRYRIRDGALFLHRKSCFEAVGLERVVMTQGRCSVLS